MSQSASSLKGPRLKVAAPVQPQLSQHGVTHTHLQGAKQQTQGTSTGQQKAQGFSTGQQGASTGQQQAPGISSGQQGASTGQQQTPIAVAETIWRQSTHDWYPKLHSQTYFLPPIYFNKMSYDVQIMAGQSVLVPQKASDQPHQALAFFPHLGPAPHLSNRPLAASIWPNNQPVPPGLMPVVQDSDAREDRAMQVVLDYIRDLAKREQEVMLVLSQLEFRKYLDNQVDPISVAAIHLLPRPATLGSGSKPRKRKSKQAKQQKQTTVGDFDVLMINSRYGLIVGEMKSVGSDPSKTSNMDKAVLKVTEKAVKQLNKEETMLRHLVSDLPSIRITKTVMLPNLTSIQLLQALGTDPQILQDLCQCIGVGADPAAAVARCLCSDKLTSSEWWQRAVTDNGPDTNMTPDIYETLVARFCGPATTVEIPTVTTPRRTVGLRTLSDAVALTGLTMALLTLYPEQVDLVNRPGLPMVFLWGPPGTGKTVVLVIKGLQWGHQGKDVHLLSSHRNSRAAILLIEHQLLHTPGIGFTATPASGSLAGTATPTSGTRHAFRKFLSALSSRTGPRVYTHFYDFDNNKGDLEAAVKELTSAASNGELFVIADEATKGSDKSDTGGDDTTGRFAEFCAQLAARISTLHLWAAAVERVVIPACMSEENVTIPVRCPPAVMRQVMDSVVIGDSIVPSYSTSAAPAPTDGPEVREIHHWDDISTVSPGHTGNEPENCAGCADDIADLMEELRVGQPGRDLQCRETIILCQNPRDDLHMVKRLHSRGLPVHVVTSSDGEAAIRDVALSVRDAVTVTDYFVVSGLERRVVVVVGRESADLNDSFRLHAMSRCTSLLVWVGGPL